MDDPTLRPYESGPYRDAIAHAALAIQRQEEAMGGHAMLPTDAAEVAVGAAVRRLVADGQLPPLGRREEPAPARRLPNSHRRARTDASPPPSDTVLAARRALGG